MQLSYVSRNGRSSESCVNTEINNGLNLASYAGNYPVILFHCFHYWAKFIDSVNLLMYKCMSVSSDGPYLSQLCR